MTHEDTTAPADDAVRTAPELDIARKIWLAGVGAYDRISAETQGVVGKLASSASETFEELVAKGEEVEERVRQSLAHSPRAEKMSHAMETAAAKAAEQRATLEARLAKVRETVSETLAPWNLPAIGQALEKLAAKVDALSHEVAALKAEKTGAAGKADKAPATN
jgi:poly(hydroxyalkanoate) granule-associated protein